MKFYLLTIGLNLYFSFAFGQDFEGTIIYSTNFNLSSQLQKAGVTKEAIVDKLKAEGKLADTIKVSYKKGNYHVLPEKLINPSWSIYRVDSNKIYNFFKGSDLCTVIDASFDMETVMLKKEPVVTLLDTTVIVATYICNVVRVKWKSGYYDYYFNPTIFKINSTLYSKHAFDGWNAYMAIAKAYPIQITKVTNGVGTVVMTMAKVEEGNIDEKLFVVPKLIPHSEYSISLPGQNIFKISK